MAPSERSIRAKRNLIVLVIVMAIVSIVYRFVMDLNYGQTSLLFIGLPALLAILLLKYWESPKSLMGVVFRVVTLFLLVSGVILGEGVICILVAAPIFYGVAGLIVLIYELLERRKNKFSVIAIVPMLLLFAQLGDYLESPELMSVSSERQYNQACALSALESMPNLNKELPLFFQLGFPEPSVYTSEELSLGSELRTSFISSTRGSGDLVWKVVKLDERQLTLSPISDNTHIGRWMTWREVRIELVPNQEGGTQVRWESEFTCDLGPSWYFKPLERYAVGLAQDHLIDSFFGDQDYTER